MHRLWILILSLVFTVSLTITALAQSTVRTGELEDAPTPQSFASINLAAGFPLDPLIISLNGGGEIPASTFSPECTGFVAEAATLTVDWTGDTEFVEAFFYSDHDPVLVVLTPEGDYLCNDDANDHLLDPVVQIDQPSHGRYTIWVGSFHQRQLIPGILVLTTRHELNVGTFELGSLIQRQRIPEQTIAAHETRDGVMPHTLLDADQLLAEVWEVDGAPISKSLVLTGTVAAFDISTPGQLCNGFIHTYPDYVVDVPEAPEHLRFLFSGDGDATLIVEDPSGSIFCNDDHVSGENLNPVVDVTEPQPGVYNVYVGRVMIEEEIEGVLTISVSNEVVPTTLKAKEIE